MTPLPALALLVVAEPAVFTAVEPAVRLLGIGELRPPGRGRPKVAACCVLTPLLAGLGPAPMRATFACAPTAKANAAATPARSSK
jgi:hypothetical protein